MVWKMLDSFHRLQDSARGYRFTQILGVPTIRRYRALVRKHVPQDPARRILEIGCGVGTARGLFGAEYTGIDVNPDYIEKARRAFEGRFEVMDAGSMSFEAGAFDDAVSIATAHHLSDEKLSLMIRKAVSVASCLHIIDAILPVARFSPFKTALFRMDRGQHVRAFGQLRDIVERNGSLEAEEVMEGPLHDVGYFRVRRRPH